MCRSNLIKVHPGKGGGWAIDFASGNLLVIKMRKSACMLYIHMALLKVKHGNLDTSLHQIE